MNRQSQWLFEVPPVSEATYYTNPYTNPEYYNPELEDEWENEWELQEVNPYGLGEEEWEVMGASINKKLQAHRSARLKLLKAIQATEKFITKKNGRIHLTLPVKNAADMANKLGIGHQAASQLLNSLQITNRKLQARKLNLAQIRLRTKLGSSVHPTALMNREAGGCAGVNNVEYHWWGIKVWLNDCNTKALSGALKIGAPISGLEKIPSPVAKALLIGAAARGFEIDAINALGGNRGVIIWYISAHPAGWTAPIFWHQ